MKKLSAVIDNDDYTFLELSKYIHASIPNGEQKTTNMSQSYYLLSILQMLTDIEGDCCGDCCEAKCVVERIYRTHQQYLNDIGSMVTACILSIKCDISEIDNKAIRTKANIFQKLPTYTKNPLEPLLRLLVKESPHKQLIGRIVGEICRGSHVDAKLSIYELEELVKKEKK